MTNLIICALAPVLICLFYIYIRDRYEKEPVRLLFVGILFGAVITFPIIQAETFVTGLMPIGGLTFDAFYESFIVAALVEESFKFAVLFFLTWRNKNLNECFDGIVYAVFISLGFAGFENILYVLNPELGGFQTAFYRAVFSVPGHAFFGVTMGYFFTMARFGRRFVNLAYAFFAAWIIHGLYDFILLSNMSFMFVFVPFIIMLWINGFIKIKKHLARSPFKYQKEP